MIRFNSIASPFKHFLLLLICFFYCASCTSQKSQVKEVKVEQESYLSKIENGLMTNVFVENAPVHYELIERMKHHKAVGFALTTIKNFKIESSKGYGYCRKEDYIDVQYNSIFRVGSISKPVTAMVVLKLHDQKVLDMDADISIYLKSWKLPASEFTKSSPVTLRNLLQHRAGLIEQQKVKLDDEGFIEGDTVLTLNDILDGKARIQAVQFDSKPGEAYKYSNQGYNLIQKVIEDITGESFEHIAEQTVLKAFEMTNSTFETSFPSPKNENYCYAYKDEMPHKGYYRNTMEKCAGGLFSNSQDLAGFLIKTAAIINEKDDFISQKIAQQIFEGKYYGLGFDLIRKDDLFLFSHSGRTAGYYSFMAMDPEKGDGFVMLVNTDGVDDLFMEMLRAISKAFNWNIWNPITISQIDIDIENYANHLGTYIIIDEGEEYKMEIVAKDNKLYYLEFDEGEVYEFPLIPTAKNVFIDSIDGNEIKFEQNGDEVPALVYDGEYRFTRE